MSENAVATVPANVDQLLAKMSDKRLGLGERISSVGEIMKATAGRMMAALPKHVSADRMIRVALNAIRKNPKLMNCTAPSLFGALTEAATYGWEIGGVMGHAYLVPYGNEATLIPGYKGLVDLCRRSGQVSTISVEVVHQGDHFHYSLGDDPHIDHRPNDKDPHREKKPIIYVYAVVRLRDGGIQRSVWSTERIDAHKEQYSKAWQFAEKGDRQKGGGKKDSFWHTAWPAAAKKTVIRDMINRGMVPVSAEYRDVVDRGLQHDDGELGLATFDVIPQGDDGFESHQQLADESDLSQDSPNNEVPDQQTAREQPTQQKTAPPPSSAAKETAPRSGSKTVAGLKSYMELRWQEELGEDYQRINVDRLAESAFLQPNAMAFIDDILSSGNWDAFLVAAEAGDESDEVIDGGFEVVEGGNQDPGQTQAADVPAFVSRPVPRPARMDLIPTRFEETIIKKKNPDLIRRMITAEIAGNPDLLADEQEYLKSLCNRRAWQLEHNVATTDRLPK